MAAADGRIAAGPAVPRAPDRFEEYLAEALGRAGLPAGLEGLSRVPLTGGRTGATVERIERAGAEPLVCKRISAGTPGYACSRSSGSA